MCSWETFVLITNALSVSAMSTGASSRPYKLTRKGISNEEAPHPRQAGNGGSNENSLPRATRITCCDSAQYPGIRNLPCSIYSGYGFEPYLVTHPGNQLIHSGRMQTDGNLDLWILTVNVLGDYHLTPIPSS